MRAAVSECTDLFCYENIAIYSECPHVGISICQHIRNCIRFGTIFSSRHFLQPLVLWMSGSGYIIGGDWFQSRSMRSPYRKIARFICSRSGVGPFWTSSRLPCGVLLGVFEHSWHIPKIFPSHLNPRAKAQERCVKKAVSMQRSRACLGPCGAHPGAFMKPFWKSIALF